MKIGDNIKCIDAIDGLTNGKVYRVNNTLDGWVQVGIDKLGHLQYYQTKRFTEE